MLLGGRQNPREASWLPEGLHMEHAAQAKCKQLAIRLHQVFSVLGERKAGYSPLRRFR